MRFLLVAVVLLVMGCAKPATYLCLPGQLENGQPAMVCVPQAPQAE